MNNKNYIHNFAKAVSEEIFSDNEIDTESYTIYTNVPVRCISDLKNGVKSPIEYSDSTSNLKVDIAFCVDEEIAFCANFNPDIREIKLFDGLLKGLPYVIPSASQSTKSFAEYAKKALSNYSVEKEKRFNKFEISVYPINSLGKNFAEFTESDLMKAKVIDENFEITNFGNACDIMECFSSTNKQLKLTFTASKYSPEKFDTSKYFKISQQNKNDKLMPLKDRLKRLDIGIPCDEAYGKAQAEKLKEFLNTPLSQIMSSKKSIYCQLKNDINQAKRLIYDTVDDFPLPEYIVTYGELMNFLYRMNKLILSEIDNDNLKLEFSNIIVTLGNFAYSDKYDKSFQQKYCRKTDNLSKKKANLKEQLDALSEKNSNSNFLFSMMLGHYCYATSLLTDSNYPNWLYRENLQYDPSFGIDYEDPPLLNRSVTDAISTARINIFEYYNDNNTATDVYVSFVFALLVLPVADINEIRKNNLGIFERRHK